MSDLGDFSCGVALIVGAGSGIGRAVSIAFGLAGARLILCDINVAALKATRDLISGLDDTRVHLEAFNVTDRDKTEYFLRSIPAMKGFGRVDWAVNTVGIVPKNSGLAIADSSHEDEEMVYSINLIAQHTLLREELKIMRAQTPLRNSLSKSESWREALPPSRGSIVTLSSWSGFHGSSGLGPHAASYPATKHAIIGLTKASAVAYAAEGIRVNSVAPGPIKTPILGEASGDTLSTIASLNPTKRLGLAGEVADLCLWLSSERATFINGTTVNIDGGWHAC